jgi:hypothetical protein
MNVEQFLKDATTLMQQIGALATTVLTVGGVVGQVIDKGKHLITVLIAPLKTEPAQPEPPATPTDEPLELVGAAPIATKGDVAILVDINQRMLVDVGRYLQQQGIDADLIIVTNDLTYSDEVRFLDPSQPAEWEDIAYEFHRALRKIKRAVGATRLHIFLATPLSLAFVLGALVGTVDENVVVYQWEKRQYWPVVTLTRDLKRRDE